MADEVEGLPPPTFWTSDPCPVWSIQPHGSARVCRRTDGVITIGAGSVHGERGVAALHAALRAALVPAVDLDEVTGRG